MKLPWLEPGDSFPPANQAWAIGDPVPGLLAAGGELTVPTLVEAYSNGIFPWFSDGQPNLWWSPDPRMVLYTNEFKLHRSLRKTIDRWLRENRLEVKFDTHFREVIENCSRSPRVGQAGTWIVPSMVEAYVKLARAGFAHSVETWLDGELAGGLYCVSVGGGVFGESMFTRVPDASKVAISALVAFCLRNEVKLIDCQQNTQHLASLGGREIPRPDFLAQVKSSTEKPALNWQFDPVYWSELMSDCSGFKP